MQIIIFGFIVRLIFSTAIALEFLPMTLPDTMQFHIKAIEYSEILSNFSFKEIISYNYQIGFSYSVFLGIIYFLFWPSLTIASHLSCIAWLLSGIVLRKTLIILKCSKIKIRYGLLIYTFLFPISVIYSSMVLRESYMLLLLNLLIFIIVNLKNLDNSLIRKLLFNFYFLITTLLLAILHNALVIFVVILYSFLLITYIKNFLKISNFISIIVLLLAISFFAYFSLFEILFDKIKTYQMGHFSNINFNRAEYYTHEELKLSEYSFFKFILYVLNNVLNYSFQPSIFKATSAQDILLTIENYFRFLIIIVITVNMIKKTKHNYLVFYTFLMFVLIESIYAQATVNWGTASRHHLPQLGLLIFAFVASYNEINKSKKKF